MLGGCCWIGRHGASKIIIIVYNTKQVLSTVRPHAAQILERDVLSRITAISDSIPITCTSWHRLQVSKPCSVPGRVKSPSRRSQKLHIVSQGALHGSATGLLSQ